MRRVTLLIVFVVLVMFITNVSFAQTPRRTVHYGTWTWGGTSMINTSYPDVWDLTEWPLELSYTLDLSNVTQATPWDTIYVEVGLREVGASNFNPGAFGSHPGGKGGWMASNYGDLATDPNNLDLDDKHILQASGGIGEQAYDALDPHTIVSSFGTFANYGIWFDRDGVDPWQDDSIANTGGVYDITIRFTAIDDTTGTMFATINGVEQWFDTTTGDGFNLDTGPAGLSFTGDMTRMQVFTGAWGTAGSGGTVIVSDITARQTPEPATWVLLLGSTAIVGAVRRRRKR